MAKKKGESTSPTTTSSDEEQVELTKFLIKEMNKGVELPRAFSLDEPNLTMSWSFIPTGCTILDYCISNRRNGGIPVGRLTEIVGEESAGKSLLATQILANTQKMGGMAVYLDTENAANPEFMKRVGLDTQKLVYLTPGTIEECYDAIEKTMTMARAKDTKCPITIVWDSTAATPAEAEIEGNYDANSRMGLAAKSHALGLRKLTRSLGFEKVTLIFCNQLKYKMTATKYQDPFTTPGGKAVPYHASVRIRLNKGKVLVDESGKEKQAFGVKTTAKVFKTRAGPAHRTATFDILFSSGIDDLDSIRDYLWEIRGVITKSAGYMKMEGPDGKELKFRAKDWSKMMQEDEAFKNFVLDKLEEFMTIKYDGQEIPELDFDENSELENG